MGIFSRIKSSKTQKENAVHVPSPTSVMHTLPEKESPSSSSINNQESLKKSRSSKKLSSKLKSNNRGKKSKKEMVPQEKPADVPSPPPTPTLSMIPSLLATIESEESSSGACAKALRFLFSLSEDEAKREYMVQEYEHFVTVLLKFIKNAERNSSEQYLALLVLNNLSIPVESKRIIAIQYNAVHLLGRLLCEDPSSHLLAIILVNLTFVDVELRKELMLSDIQLIDALSYALWVSCSYPEDHMDRKVNENTECQSPRDWMIKAMWEEEQRGKKKGSPKIFDSSRLLYPETARWCLCAIKNLTRPCKEPAASKETCRTGIVPLLLRMITVEDRNQTVNNDKSSSSNSLNSPCNWEANSIQDAALFTILNLSTYDFVRNYLKKEGAIEVLTLITDFLRNRFTEHEDSAIHAQFQRLKARMALSYIIAPDNNFGQLRCRSPASYKNRSRTPSPTHHVAWKDPKSLNVTHEEVELFLELFANVLHQRAKEGAIGGYAAGTFTLKGVVHSIRCLLSVYANQVTFASVAGPRLNFLLFKALCMFVIQRIICVDVETAEHLCFSLYLLSNFGFQNRFMPLTIGYAKIPPLVKKLMQAYLQYNNITPAGSYAANQILLRCDFLIFQGSTSEISTNGLYVTDTSDYTMEDDIIVELNRVNIRTISAGSKPMPIIFERPILRARVSGGRERPLSHSSIWENKNTVVEYPSALAAAQELYFGTLKAMHRELLSDIFIANTIASSANGEITTAEDSYNYWWTWKDSAEFGKQIMEEAKNSLPYSSKELNSTSDTRLGIKGMVSKDQMKEWEEEEEEEDDGPMTIFGIRCGMCHFNY